MQTGKTLIITILTSLIVGSVTFFGLQHFSGSSPKSVLPPFVGIEISKARAIGKTLGLKISVTEEKATSDHTAGEILSQTPAPGTSLTLGSVLKVTLAKAPSIIQVPKIIGMSKKKAIQKLTKLGLVSGQITTKPSADMAEGSVLSTKPAPGAQVNAKTRVDMVISIQGTEIKVPRVQGRRLSQAKQIITKAGFVVGRIKYRFDEDLSPNVVLAQTPKAESPAPQGTTVKMTVNKHDY